MSDTSTSDGVTPVISALFEKAANRIISELFAKAFAAETCKPPYPVVTFVQFTLPNMDQVVCVHSDETTFWIQIPAKIIVYAEHVTHVRKEEVLNLSTFPDHNNPDAWKLRQYNGMESILMMMAANQQEHIIPHLSFGSEPRGENFGDFIRASYTQYCKVCDCVMPSFVKDICI